MHLPKSEWGMAEKFRGMGLSELLTLGAATTSRGLRVLYDGCCP